MQPVVIAIIFVCGTIIGPVLLSILNNRQHKKEKQEDYARQDQVALQVRQAAAQAAEAAELLRVSNERIADQVIATNKVTNKKLDQIHTLVNSNMTAAMQSELDAIVSQHALMLEVGSLKQASGLEITETAKAAEAAIATKMQELRATLKDRLDQTAIANAQITK